MNSPDLHERFRQQDSTFYQVLSKDRFLQRLAFVVLLVIFHL